MPIIEIDGKKIEAEAGSMIIQVADKVGIQIPRFCYHAKLSIAANCRMCLIEVERAPKPLPACATPVAEGMKVWTRSPKALIAQKSVMEFLLINHPLDCPICDQGGECELQDLSVGFGTDDSRYSEGKRVVKDKDLGPLISSDMTRCIQCTRCVRFGSEVAGFRELGATGRGECMEIGTFIERNITSEVSGNVIDICPVGALTSKPFRFTARGWELKQTPSIGPHDCLGSNLFIHVRDNKVMRVVPKENETINEVWLSDRDRFSYEGLYRQERLIQPKIKRKGHWQTVSWLEALEFAAKSLNEAKGSGRDMLGGLISPNATLEEAYLFQKLIRSLGSNNIDHRLRQIDFRDQEREGLYPDFSLPLSEIEKQSRILLLGSDIRQEQPILGIKLRKMALAGGKVLVLNPIDFQFNFNITAKNIVPGGDLLLALAGLAKVLLEKNVDKSLETGLKEAKHWLAKIKPTEIDVDMADHFLAEGQKLILLGAYSISHPNFSQLKDLCRVIAQLTDAKWGVLSEGANSTGAWIAGCIPHRLPMGKRVENLGLTALEMCDQTLETYLLCQVEPDLDCLNGLKALQTIGKAKRVIAITAFESKALCDVADVLLPMAAFTETPGTYVNIEGQWQSFKPAVTPLGDSRPAWKILRVLGNLCEAEGFDFESLEEVLGALETEEKGIKDFDNKIDLNSVDLHPVIKNDQTIIRIAPIPLYAGDALLRRATSLQKTAGAGDNNIRLNSHLAKRLKLSGSRAKVSYNGHSLTLPFIVDETVPDNSVMIFGGHAETLGLGDPYSEVELQCI